MLISELYNIMVNKVTFVSFRGGDSPPLDPLLFAAMNPVQLVVSI